MNINLAEFWWLTFQNMRETFQSVDGSFDNVGQCSFSLCKRLRFFSLTSILFNKVYSTNKSSEQINRQRQNMIQSLVSFTLIMFMLHILTGEWTFHLFFVIVRRTRRSVSTLKNISAFCDDDHSRTNKRFSVSFDFETSGWMQLNICSRNSCSSHRKLIFSPIKLCNNWTKITQIWEPLKNTSSLKCHDKVNVKCLKNYWFNSTFF